MAPKKMGRPKSSLPRDVQITIRLNDEECKELVKVAEHLKVTKVEAIRIGITKLYKDIQKR